VKATLQSWDAVLKAALPVDAITREDVERVKRRFPQAFEELSAWAERCQVRLERTDSIIVPLDGSTRCTVRKDALVVTREP